MNLQQTIDELEARAQQYQEAADNLRALSTSTRTAAASTPRSTAVPKAAATGKPVPANKPASKNSGAKKGAPGGRPKVSDETRAKISEKLKAAHAARKATAASS